jgi:hypothetical protein
LAFLSVNLAGRAYKKSAFLTRQRRCRFLAKKRPFLSSFRGKSVRNPHNSWILEPAAALPVLAHIFLKITRFFRKNA